MNEDCEHGHLVVLPLCPCVPCEDRGKGKEGKNNKEPKSSIQQGQVPVDEIHESMNLVRVYSFQKNTTCQRHS